MDLVGEFRAPVSMLICVAASAATLSADQARAQLVTTGTTRIQAADETGPAGAPATTLRVAGGGATVAVSSLVNGAISLTAPTFMPQSSRTSAGLRRLAERERKILTGKTLSSDAFSVSVADGASSATAPMPFDGVRVVLFQFN